MPEIEKLCDWCKVLPRFEEFDMQKIYYKFQVLPKEEYIQKAYCIMMKNEDFKDIQEMTKLTKIKPSVDAYKILIDKIMSS